MKIPQMLFSAKRSRKNKNLPCGVSSLHGRFYFHFKNIPIQHHAEEEQKRMVFHLRLRLARCWRYFAFCIAEPLP